MSATISEPQHKRKTAPPEQNRFPDAQSLVRKLKRQIEGEVRFDDGSRALYATDGSNYRQVPIGVVIPRTVEDVMATVEACRQFGAPLLPRGGGTSLAGQCCNVAVVMDFTKYLNRVLEIDSRQRLARVEPGCVLDDLRDAANRCGLTFGPDPATHSHCALGGMLGNNSCGIHSLLSVKNGLGMRTSDNTHQLEVLTYQGQRIRVGPTSPEELEEITRRGGPRGEIYGKLRQLRDKYAEEIRKRFPRLPRRVSGYNLNDLLPESGFHVARSLVGSEGTCAITLEATLHLVPNPKARTLLVVGYPDVFSAADHLMEILEHRPIGLEGIDHLLIDWIKAQGKKEANLELFPPGRGWLLVAFGGESKEDSDDQAKRVIEMLKKHQNPPSMKLFDQPHEEEMVWKVRESGLGATAWMPGRPDNWPGFEDSAVPPEKVRDYLHDFRDLLGKYQYMTSLYGHFGQGCIHCRIPFDLYTAQGIQNYRDFMAEATDLVMKYDGSLSGEHGDGQARAEWLPKMFGPELMQAFREFKRIWDPNWRMNPGKVIDANSMTADLRLGADYNPPSPRTHFKYPNDQRTFARAALRCVGVGECRRKGGQTMCPSYQVTLEEKHSTRGRARLLWEMLNGNVLKGGWRNESVKDALDLCLSCKGCKGDCPVNVDMATYKAEFLSHYYQGRLRPRYAYAFGLVHVWARLASIAPGLANFISQTPGLSQLAKWVGGVTQHRPVPPFAPVTFKEWFAARKRRNVGGPPVVLWADTFNNFFHPEVACAAVTVLEDAGFYVRVPKADMCCGRPLYDYGMLKMAGAWLRDILEKLRDEIEAGIPIVVLEPSCCAVFRDELPAIFPNNLDGKRLTQNTFTLAEFLEKKAPHYVPPKVGRKAVVHRHCHHKAVLGFEADQRLLKKMGLDYEILESGCCGLAGSFGFEPGEHYKVSVACGEQVLLPAVRRASDDQLILSDGFSCRTQIAQNTDREALHVAQVIQMASQNRMPHSGPPEAPMIQNRKAALQREYIRSAAGVGALTLLAIASWKLLRRKVRA